MEKFIKTKTFEYKGKKYKLIERLNSHHQIIRKLLGSLETAKKAQSEKYEYKVYFRKGMTYRDDSILRFINYPQKGRTTIKELEQNYKGVLSLEEIEKSLVKLVELNCLSVEDSKIEITDIATKIL
jgi:DNA polymerase I-like protein with 3'-5' exonuclease and polymerase domains